MHPLFSTTAGVSSSNTIKDQFAALARQIPGFGGLFYDSTGQLTGNLVDVSTSATAAQSLTSFMASHRFPRTANGRGIATPADVRFQAAKYDYVTLKLWFDSIYRPVLAMRGAVSLGIDERADKLHLWFSDNAALLQAQTLLTTFGIPTGGVILEITQPITQSDSGVRMYQRPVVGGLQVLFRVPTIVDIHGWAECTLGINVHWVDHATQPFFFTASHCGSNQFADDGDEYHQGGWLQDTVASSRIGTEAWNPQYLSGGYNCPSGSVCRWSDSRIQSYDVGAQGAAAFGGIAWPTGWADGTLDISNPATKTLVIVEDGDSSALQGLQISKIGRSTGVTTGTITQTCSPLTFMSEQGGVQITLFCQYTAQMLQHRGDSGSPVFFSRTADSNETLVGMMWGGDTLPCPSCITRFSSVTDIRTDYGSKFGNFSTHGVGGVVVQGPQYVQPGSYCYYSAAVNGGLPPYSYTWSGVLSGSGSASSPYSISISGVVNNSGTLQLQVWPADGGTQTGSLYIDADYQAPSC